MNLIKILFRLVASQVFFVGLFSSYAQVVGSVGSQQIGFSSPTASSLGKVSDVPVSLTTGTVGITIPLYEVRGRQINLPIGASYQGSGIKVEERAGWIGLGWSLNVGGVITRTVRGLPDDLANGYYFTGDDADANWPTPSTSYVQDILYRDVDPEPDMFFFNFGGYSGKFNFGSDQKVYCSPYQQLHFSWQFGGSGEIVSWTIIAEDGTKYIFSAIEKTTDNPRGLPSLPSYSSSWFLTSIVSVAGGEEMTLSYTTPTTVTHTVGAYEESFHWIQFPCEAEPISIINDYAITQIYLDAITTPHEVLSFYRSGREDITNEKKLDSIVVTRNNQRVKKISFGYGYFTGDEERLRLETITEYSPEGLNAVPYSFQYNSSSLPGTLSFSVDHWGYYNQASNTTILPTIIVQNPSTNDYVVIAGANREPEPQVASDGLLKKIVYPTGGFAEFTYESHDYSGVHMSSMPKYVETPQSAYAEANSAQEIYETTTNFTISTDDPYAIVHFESEMYPEYTPPSPFTKVKVEKTTGELLYQSSVSNIFDLALPSGNYRIVATALDGWSWIQANWTNKDTTSDPGVVIAEPAGGARIRKIRYHDGVSTENDKYVNYVYRAAADSNRSSGVLVSKPQYTYMYQGPSCGFLSRSSVTRTPLGITQGSHISYGEVLVLYGNNGSQGKTRHYFTTSLNAWDDVSDESWWPFQTRSSYDHKRGLPVKTEHFSANGTLTKSVSYTHQIDTEDNLKLIKAFSFKHIEGYSAESTDFPLYYWIPSEWLYKTTETATTYDQNGQNPVTTVKQYFYENPDHTQLTKTTETNSDGSIRTARMKYPLDYSTTSPSSADAMVRALDSMKTVGYIVSPMIEQVVTEQKTGGSEMLVLAQLTKYKGFASAQHLPSERLTLRDTSLTYASFTQSSSSTSAFTHDSRYYAAQKFEQYDSYGNPMQSKDAYDTPTAYKWALNSAVPVAIFHNASNAQTFFDEFGDGNLSDWVVTDNYTAGNTQWAIENGWLKQTNNASAIDYEYDRITYDHGTEITGDVVLEFDLRIGDSNNWDLIIAMGGNQWDGTGGGTENAVWTAFNNEQYYTYYTSWNNITGLNIGKKYHLKIVAKGSTGKSDYYVDGNLILKDINYRVSTTGIQKIIFGHYGLGTITSTWYIDNVRLYPASALVTSAAYDSVSLLVKETQDENGAVTRYEYDPFQRLVRTRDNSARVINAQNYYYSRAFNGDVFNSNDPNFVETAAYPEGAPTDGLVGHWRLEGNGFDETGNNNLNLVGTAWSRGYLGTTKTFDGTKTKYAHAPLISAYQTQRPTMTAWVKLSSTSTSWTIANVNVQGAWMDGRGFYLATNPSGQVAFIVGNASGSWKVVTGATSLQANTWYHVAGTYDGTYLRIYVNGVLDGSNNIGSVTLSYTPYANKGPNPSTFYIGIQHNANNSSPTNDPDLAYPFNGYIDDVRIYNRALTATEIKSLASPHIVTTYIDGLGRDIQTQSRLGNDNIVAGKKYDALGRDWKIFKPYQISLGANAHKYTANDSANSNNYYAGLDNDEADTGGYPYTEFEYFLDPLNRIKRQAAPGATFRMGTGKEVKLEYWSNGGSDVSGYSANTLLKTRRKDEDDKVVDTFTDRFGNTVATTTDYAGLNLKTTFEYNVLGNVTKSIPPKGSSYASTYKYNTLQQMREKASPDAGTAKYLYDKNGNVRLIKDANHTGTMNSVNISGSYVYAPYSTNGQFTLGLGGRVSIGIDVNDLGTSTSMTILVKKNDNTTVLCSLTTNEWTGVSEILTLPADFYYYEVSTTGTEGQFSYWITCATGLELTYNKYDVFNRVIESGEYQSSSTSSLTQANADNTSFPTSGQIIRSKFIYDNPSSDPLAAGQRNLKGRVSAAESYRLGTLALTTFYSYDELGRVEWVLHKGLGSYSKKVKYTYDLQGRVVKKEYTDAQSASYNLFTYNEYDQMGRLTKVSTNTTDNPGTATKEGEYTYFAPGIAKDLKLGNNIQQVDYRYNTRDWLKHINDISTIGSDKFAEILYYNESLSGSTPRYNGNIAVARYRNIGVSASPFIGYHLAYDGANRLTSAQTYTYTTSWVTTNNYKEPSISYDANGNISSYQRYGHNGSIMDNLTYNYWSNTNRLNYIDDAVGSGSFTTDIDDQSSSNNKYDGNGNMQQDLQKSIKLVVYDINNLPVVLYKADGTQYKYYYDTQGNRVRKEEGVTEYYVQGADGSTEVVVKSDGSLATHNIKGADAIGQVKRNSTTWTRYYYLTDHLGSVRVIVNSSGAVDSYLDYYPFGMTMEGRNGSSSADPRYKFTGKERDVQTGYDYFGARYYDARIARWLAVDPLAEKFAGWSPYNYVLNNPIKMIDPDGKRPYTIIIRSFIPQSTVSLGPLNFKGDNRNFDNLFFASRRTQQVINVETDPTKNANPLINNFGHTGTTTKIQGNKEAKKLAKVRYDATATRTESNGGDNVQVQATISGASNPFLPGAPPIDYNLTVGINPNSDGSTTVDVQGTVNDFPAFEVIIIDDSGKETSVLRSWPTTGPRGVIDLGIFFKQVQETSTIEAKKK